MNKRTEKELGFPPPPQQLFDTTHEHAQSDQSPKEAHVHETLYTEVMIHLVQ